MSEQRRGEVVDARSDLFSQRLAAHIEHPADRAAFLRSQWRDQ